MHSNVKKNTTENLIFPSLYLGGKRTIWLAADCPSLHFALLLDNTIISTTNFLKRFAFKILFIVTVTPLSSNYSKY